VTKLLSPFFLASLCVTFFIKNFINIVFYAYFFSFFVGSSLLKMTKSNSKKSRNTHTNSDKNKEKIPSATKKKASTKKNKSKATTAKANYSFDPNSAVAFQKTTHLVSFKCKINGTPRPQARNFGKTNGYKKLQMFSPSKQNQEMFGQAFKEAMSMVNQKLFTLSGTHPCTVSVIFFFPRPKSHYFHNNETKQYELCQAAPLFLAKTPDLDNCIKLVLDALQGICYKNDFQVAHIEATKQYDHTQLVWKSGQTQSSGCTIIKVTEIDDSKYDSTCSCLSCKYKNK
jgi:Holliday junction resolvase RusA-like endonuclease